jgi:hypothetical protein
MSAPAGARRRRGWRVAALAPALAIAGLVLLPAAAGAGPSRYVFEICDSALPGGGDAGVKFAKSPGQPWSAFDTCDQPGGSLLIRLDGSTAGGDATFAGPIDPPPGGSIESITASGAACVNDGGVTAYMFFAPGWPAARCMEEQRIYPTAPGHQTQSFEINLVCYGYSGPCGPGSSIYGHYFATVEVDPVKPVLTNLKGSLLGSAPIRGRRTISAEAHDEGGGLSNLSVQVNGLPGAQPKVLNCNVAQANNLSVIGTVAAQVTPCPSDASAEWTLDTGAYPFHDGANTVQVCASDFATLSDPNTTCLPAHSVEVDNSCAESAVDGGQLLSAQFSGSNAEQITVNYGEGAEVSGRLASDAGNPISGATLCVKMQTPGVDAAPLPVGTVKTDGAGNYAYQVPPGPNREIVIGYRHDTSQVTRDVSYYAHTLPSLQASPRKLENGKPVRFWGQLPGPNGGGRVVVLQASVVGSKRWITFRKATTNPQAVFRAAYHFTSTTRKTTYRFRAVVPDQAGYPWVQGHSKPVRVRVAP